MGNPLTGSTVASTYTSILKTTDNATISGTLKTVTDGAGTDSALQVSNAGVKSTGTFDVTGATNLSSLSTSGNATVGGTLGVTGATTLSSTLNVTGATTLGALTMTGNLSVPGTLSSTGNFAVNTNKFTVDASNGNTAVAGTLGVTGATSLSSVSTSGAATVGTTLGVTGDFAVATNKLTVASATGNTAVAGTLGAAGDFAVATNKFTVAAATGNTAVAGTLGVTGNTTLTGNLSVEGNTTIGNASGDSLTVTAGAVTIDNLSSKATPVDADTVLLRDSAASNALKTATTDSLKVVKLVYSEGISKTGGAGQSISISGSTPYAIQESGSTATWEYTWTPKTVGNKCVIRVAVPLETDTQGSYYVGVTTTPVSAPTSYIGVGSAYASAAAASPVNIIAEMVFTSTAASHTFQMYLRGATSNVIIAKNASGYYFGQTGATLQAKVQFTLMEYA